MININILMNDNLNYGPPVVSGSCLNAECFLNEKGKTFSVCLSQLCPSQEAEYSSTTSSTANKAMS